MPAPKLKGYIPLDKSWTIRMGILDLLYGNTSNTLDFIKSQPSISDDIRALGQAIEAWRNDAKVDVGESGTLYRFLKFASWKLKLKKQFIIRGTLSTREICNNPAIVSYPIDKLLTLDNGTSQWASAAVLCGKQAQTKNTPNKLRLTFEAVSHWRTRHAQAKPWMPRFDRTIERQAQAYLDILDGQVPVFEPIHSEDYCFARAFKLISAKEGEFRWPSLRGHESDRIDEIEVALTEMESGDQVTSADHRIIQAVAMLAKTRFQSCGFKHPEAVNKSWPLFWDFLSFSVSKNPPRKTKFIT